MYAVIQKLEKELQRTTEYSDEIDRKMYLFSIIKRVEMAV
jgi:hypothetical protein